MNAPAPTSDALAQDGATPRPRLVAYVVDDGREVPIYARRELNDVARDAVRNGRRLLSSAATS